MALFKTKRRNPDFATTDRSGAASVELEKLLRQRKIRDDIEAIDELYVALSKERDDLELVETDSEAAA